jgi:ribose transport system substrate-binding protein
MEGVPLVLEGNRVEGMQTLVAICDYDAGYKGGLETGKIAKEMGITPRILAVDLPALTACVLRVDGFYDGIRVHAPDAELVHRVDGKGSKDEALQVSTDALIADSDINVIYGCNDNSSLGAYQAYKAAGLDETDLIVCGTGLEGLAAVYALQEIPAYKVEAAMLPEKNGLTCVDAAVSLYRGEEVSEHIVSATVAVTKDTWEDLYGIDADGNRYPKWDAINALPTEAQCTKYTPDN